MRSLTIEPLTGASGAEFGDARESVHAVLGAPHKSFKRHPSDAHVTDAWDENSLQVSYVLADAQLRLQFMEFYAPSPGVQLYDMTVFSTRADALIAKLEKLSAGKPISYEGGCLVVFHDLELAFWRPEPTARLFSTVSIGQRGYYGFLLG